MSDSNPISTKSDQLVVRHMGEVEYQPTLDAMREFTDKRDDSTVDEIWVLQHPPVYTQGQAGVEEHVIDTGEIPIVKIDRGGQVTYHGPGQLTVYLLVDVGRRKMFVRDFVTAIEQSIIATLAEYQITASGRRDAPGVYVDEAKIASLGLKIRRGRSYHGLALNVDMDMQPWSGINPCGLGVAMTQISDLCDPTPPIEAVAEKLVNNLAQTIGYNAVQQNNPVS